MIYIILLKILLIAYIVNLITRLIECKKSTKRYQVIEIKDKSVVKKFSKFQNKLKYAGYDIESEIKLLIFIRYFFIFPFALLVYASNGYSISYGLLSLIMYVGLFNIFIQKKIKERNNVIEFNGYKIFKFLLNQISSGILISDAIKSMYLVVNDAKLRACLIDVSAYYIQTTDINESLLILKNQYKGIEVDTLCVAIQQGVYTGGNIETMQRMEIMLFKKYILHIKRETDSRRNKSFLAVLLLCLIIILLVAIPLTIDILSAFNQIFI